MDATIAARQDSQDSADRRSPSGHAAGVLIGQQDEVGSTERSIDHLEDLRRDYGYFDGLALLRAISMDNRLRGKIALVSSFGAESAVLLDMVATVDPAIPVIFLDTGKLFDETHDYREELTRRLRLKDVRIVRPEPNTLTELDTDGDLWRRAPDRCCHLRKTVPLDAALAGFSAWITGRKRFHGEPRIALPVIEGEPSTGRVKVNPLALWSAEDVDHYRRLRNLPAHPLAAQGYRSIGCATCTRPVGPTEDQRAGRWWGTDKTECGIHRPGT